MSHYTSHMCDGSLLAVHVSYWTQFTEFCFRIGYVATSQEVDELVESGNIPEMMPTWIALWIMDK